MGPYTTEQMIGFAQAGNVTRESLVWTEGQSEWMAAGAANGLFAPVAGIPNRDNGSIGAPMPRRMSGEPGRYVPTPRVDQNSPVWNIAGTKGLSPSEVMEDIARGGRFVTFRYVISLLFVTFRRTTRVRFVRADESAAGDAWVPTLITLIAGWWGIPWGPIFSVRAIFTNAGGGLDVTEAMLAPVTGAIGARALLAGRPKAKAGANLWSVWGMVILIPFLFSCLVLAMVARSSLKETRRLEELQRLPGYEGWHNADGKLNGNADGNNNAARAVAGILKTMLDDADGKFTTSSGRALPREPVGVWCEFREHDTIVLLQWDKYWRITGEDRTKINRLIWEMTVTMSSRSETGCGAGTSLTVGVKCESTWCRAFLGKLPEVSHSTDSKPDREITGDDVRRHLISAFAPPARH